MYIVNLTCLRYFIYVKHSASGRSAIYR